jgi:hypothetical protein
MPDSIPPNNKVSRVVTVLPPSPDSSPPQIESLTINYGALVTSKPQVVLNTMASDPDGAVAYIYYVEYVFDRNLGDWNPIGASGWKPFALASLDYDWVLDPTPGVHYIQSWVADRLGNVSQPKHTPINFIPPKNFIVHNDGQIFRIHLNAGDTIQINLTSLIGNADMYIWGPGGIHTDTPTGFDPFEEVSFMATVTGVYQMDVFGFDDGLTSYWFEVTFDVPITPLGLAPTGVEGHVQGGDRPLLVVEDDPGADNGIPIPPVDGYIMLPIIVR